MFYILHGEDDLSRSEALARLRGEWASNDPAMDDLNTSTLDGTSLTLGELRHICDSIPFMSDRRQVIVHGLLERLSPPSRARDEAGPEAKEPAWKKEYLQGLQDYLPNLPPTTRLVFVESLTLPSSHLILKLAQKESEKGRAKVQLFARPRDEDLPGWIRRRAQKVGGTLSSEAVAMLAALVGNDLRLLDQEIQKLVLYADGRQVTSEDVQALVSYARQTNIFELVDYVGQRQAGRALQLLHHMLEDGEHPLYLLAMLARQIRILIQVSELRAQRLSEGEIASRLNLHPFVAKKGLAQARNFTMAQLEAAHRCLVETDRAIKTGKSEDVLALDMLIVALSSI